MASKKNDVHYGMLNLAGPDYVACASRPQEDDDLTTGVMDEITCWGCRYKLIHMAVSFLQAWAV